LSFLPPSPNLTQKLYAWFLSDFCNIQADKRQAKMLGNGIKGFKGGMTAKKYISIAKTSKATATHDLQDMVEKQCLHPVGAGRGVHYDLNMEI